MSSAGRPGSQDAPAAGVSSRWTAESQPAPPSTINRGEYAPITCVAAPSWSASAWVRNSASRRLTPDCSQALENRAFGRAGVDEHGGRAELDEGRVALADVEERHDQLARSWRGLGAPQGDDEHRRGDERRGGDGEPRAARASGASRSRPRPAAPPDRGRSRAHGATRVRRAPRPERQDARGGDDRSRDVELDGRERGRGAEVGDVLQVDRAAGRSARRTGVRAAARAGRRRPPARRATSPARSPGRRGGSRAATRARAARSAAP